jgi:heme/copper-type cytochrome/quinol oxidase subunit 1
MPGFSPTNDELAPLTYNNTVAFVGFAFLVVLPLLAFTGLLADTLRRGAVRLLSPLLWSVAALLMLLAGAANGAIVSIDPLDLLTTTASAAQIHYVLVAVLLGFFGGLVFWAPKIWGRMLPEGASSALAVGGLLGCVLLSLPDLVAGFFDQALRLGGASDDISTIEALNIASAIGGGLLVLIALGFLGLLARTATGTADAEDDPWNGHTLEWATTSPPAAGNFTGELPPITSEAPVYDARHAAEVAS